LFSYFLTSSGETDGLNLKLIQACLGDGFFNSSIPNLSNKTYL
jgi:hypothetical protein